MGTVYVLVNEVFPNLVKIGYTNGDLHRRVSRLFDTGVPSPFEVAYAVEAPRAREIEQVLHRIFATCRWAANREFFAVAVETVIEALGLCAYDILGEVVGRHSTDHTEGLSALDGERQGRRSNVDLAAIGIHPGDVLTWLADPSVTVTVARGNKVILDDETLSLSAAADVVIKRHGGKGGVSGTKYWAYDGELIDLRRRRIESQG